MEATQLLSTPEFNWALGSLLHNAGDGNFIGDIQADGWMAEVNACLYGQVALEVYIGTCKNRKLIFGGSTVSSEFDRIALIKALAPVLKCEATERDIFLMLHRAIKA